MDEQETGEEERTVKVSIPVRLRMKLHILKILEGQNLSKTVEVALEDYFEKTGMDEINLPSDETELIGLGKGKKQRRED